MLKNNELLHLRSKNEVTNAKVGFAGPIGIKIQVIIDESI